MKVILIPGNGGATPNDIWLPYIKKEVEKLGVKVISVQFPDSFLARSEYWLPFLKNTLKADADTVLIGHSSGAIAAMRFAEQNQILGSVLISSYYTHLDNDYEKMSGYFDTPWNWQAIKSNQKWIIQFASLDDHMIPINEPRFVHQQLKTEYHELPAYGHFQTPQFPELLASLKPKLIN